MRSQNEQDPVIAKILKDSSVTRYRCAKNGDSFIILAIFSGKQHRDSVVEKFYSFGYNAITVPIRPAGKKTAASHLINLRNCRHRIDSVHDGKKIIVKIVVAPPQPVEPLQPMADPDGKNPIEAKR